MARFQLVVDFDDTLADDPDDPILYVQLAASNAVYELRNRPGITIESAVLTDRDVVIADRDGTIIEMESWPACETVEY